MGAGDRDGDEKKSLFDRIKSPKSWKARAKRVRNRFTESKKFKALCMDAWRECDMDGDGTLDAAEVYIAVLLLYLKLGRIVPGCVPPDKHIVTGLCKQMDVDGDGSLNEDEFLALATVLCETIAGRVMVEGVTLYAVGPVIAMLATWLLSAMFDMDALLNSFGEEWRETLDYIVDMTVVCIVFMLVCPWLSQKLDQYASRKAKENATKLKDESAGFSEFGGREGILCLAEVVDPGTTRLRKELPAGHKDGDLYFGEVTQGQIVAVLQKNKAALDAHNRHTYDLVRTRVSKAQPQGVTGYVKSKYLRYIRQKD
eukprot:TRINITY_DN1697_c0_g3_i1.p1 TRINITY_DN1697_c0_g3~~TRINITY_DN1697_c0_g3_i1.p1  ORF type:complete len:312 (+),score=78.32 TRINITY_DN1697_c0_g3_i1:78-1013(+)